MSLKERIQQKEEVRQAIAGRDQKQTAFLLISESIDDYIKHRIESDKVLEGIVQDIQGDIASLAIREEVKSTFGK